MRRTTLFLITLALCSFALHFVWEYLHLPLYTGYEALGEGLPLVIYATLGDVLYTLLVVGLCMLLARSKTWAEKLHSKEYFLLALSGFLVALFVEYKAQVLGRWVYTDLMPTLFGIGLDPLLQMTLLLPLSVYLANKVATRFL